MRKLFYLPLEAYVERYTYLMSSVDGWAETWLKKFNVNFERIDGVKVGDRIKVGSVLDGFGRSIFAMSQVEKMLGKIKDGEIKNGDVIYTEDFWHPGIEALFYVRDLIDIDFKIGCFLHAQSIDDSDFTYPMRRWMRDMEVGMSKGYDYIFTCSHILRAIAVEAGYDRDHIFKTGLPYNSERLLEQLKDMEFVEQKKERFVLFSSRFDTEKNPNFFLDLVEACSDIQFKLVKPREHITDDKEVENRLNQVLKKCSNLELVDTSNKIKYYEILSKAEIQFNCAYQDWVSWTLLEAVTFNCKPLYPNWKDFSYELKGYDDHIYEMDNLEDCKKKLYSLLNKKFDSRLKQIAERHNGTWKEYLEVMNFV